MDQTAVTYAGFWKRFVAYLIDSIVLSVAGFLAILPILGLIGLGVSSAMSGDSESMIGFMIAAIGAYDIAILALSYGIGASTNL